jgi:hypothetical protein
VRSGRRGGEPVRRKRAEQEEWVDQAGRRSGPFGLELDRLVRDGPWCRWIVTTLAARRSMTPKTEAAPIPASPQSNPPVEPPEIALGTVGRVRSAVEGAEMVPLSGDPERPEKDLAALGRRLVRQ